MIGTSVRHYEDIRFKFSQITIALAAALVGASRLSGIEGGNKALVALCIVVLGITGITRRNVHESDRLG